VAWIVSALPIEFGRSRGFKGRSIDTKGDVANKRGAICAAMRSILINQREGSSVENKIPWLVLERAKLELEAAVHVFVTQSIR
jgi:hypothetical protein